MFVRPENGPVRANFVFSSEMYHVAKEHFGDHIGNLLLQLVQEGRSDDSLFRREFFMEEPAWHLQFKIGPYFEAKNFLDDICHYMVLLERNPTLASGSFHSDTGILCRVLTEFVKAADNVDKLLPFLDRYYAYMRGEKTGMPRNVSRDKIAYSALRTVSQNSYSVRLIKEYKAEKTTSLGKTQDFALLYRTPIYSFVETVLMANNDNEIVSFIDSHRK